MIRSRPRAGSIYVAAGSLLILSCAAAGLSFRVPASAAAASGSPSGAITLTEQTPWVTSTAGIHLTVSVTSDVPRADLGLSVTLWSQATDRSYFEESLTGDTAGFTPIDQPALLPLTNKGLLDAAGEATMDLPVSAPGLPGRARSAPRDGALLSIPCTTSCPGVYPLQVSLEDVENAATLSSFMTYLVLAPNEASSPLRFAWVLPVGTAPATSPKGRAAPARADRVEISELEAALSANPSVSVSIALYPQLVEALESGAGRSTTTSGKTPASGQAASGGRRTATADRNALVALRRLAGLSNAQIESETFTPVDVAGVAGANLAGELQDQFAAARRTDAAAGIATAKGEFAATTALGSRAASLLESDGVSHIVVPSNSVEAPPADWEFPAWAPFLVKGTSIVADASDYYLEQHLESGANPVLRANQLLADLADLYFAAPEEIRGVSLLAPAGWHPSTQFLSVVMNGLASSRVIKTVTQSQLFSQVPPGSAEPPLLFRKLHATIPSDDNLPGAAIRTARTGLGALSSLVPKDPSLVNELNHLLLLSESAGLTLAERQAYLTPVTKRLGTLGTKISLPIGRTITVTSLSARVPVSIYSRATTPLHVKLWLSSPSPELSFRHKMFQVVLEPRNNTVEIQLKARTSGDFPLVLRVTTAAVGVSLGTGRLLIRSTAISGVAVGLTAGAGAFLLLWWSRSALKRRRKRGRSGTSSLDDSARPAAT